VPPALRHELPRSDKPNFCFRELAADLRAALCTRWSTRRRVLEHGACGMGVDPHAVLAGAAAQPQPRDLADRRKALVPRLPLPAGHAEEVESGRWVEEPAT